MKRRRVLAWLWLAACAPALASAAVEGPESARLVVQDTTDRMLRVLKAERDLLRQKPERIYALVNQIILPHFDFTRMSRWVLGRYWRDATEEQRTRFVQEFRRLLVRTYATALLEYADQSVDVLPLQAEAGATDVLVRTEVKQAGAPPIPLHYRMSLVEGAWRVYDLTIDGVSLVASYRSTFANEAANGGLERVIALLVARNEATGAPAP
jgi:phospholipid transport system substrate-binding protein